MKKIALITNYNISEKLAAAQAVAAQHIDIFGKEGMQ